MDKQEIIRQVDLALKREFKSHSAPIIELIEAQTHDPFCVLVGTILSARTKDACTTGAVKRLFAAGCKTSGTSVLTPESLEKLSVAEIEKLIYPVGFYRDKARHLKALPKVLKEKFGGVLPKTVEELCELPGVGRKTANLTVAVGFDLPAICVDVHVHRICNNLKLVKTKTPLETEMALRALLPVKYWKTWNSHLVSFGQTRCLPRGAHCEGCPIAQFCSRAPVDAVAHRVKGGCSLSTTRRASASTMTVAHRVVILANGDYPKSDSPAGKILAAAKRVVACDGAADSYRAHAGRMPDYTVGDLDSIGQCPTAARQLRGRGVSPRQKVRSIPPAVIQISEQETNDLEKAISVCRQKSWNDLVIVGASGRREDHTLSNIFRAMALGVEVVSDFGRFIPFTDQISLQLAKGTPVSVFATDPLTRMTSTGLAWPLDGVTFSNLYCATLNRASSSLVEIRTNRPAFVYVGLTAAM